MATVTLSLSIVLIVSAAVHIFEEARWDFRGFFNTKWFDGNENCPVGPTKGRWVDQVFLFVLLAALSLAGARLDGRWILVAVGIVAADLLQHSIFSVSKLAYTPGIVTSAVYLVYVGYFFADKERRTLASGTWGWAALASGALFIGGNHLYASGRVRLGRARATNRGRRSSKPNLAHDEGHSRGWLFQACTRLRRSCTCATPANCRTATSTCILSLTDADDRA